MQDALLISVRLYEGWYHGSGETPSPARLFQALVAGAGLSGPLDKQTVAALKWLEGQEPPIMAAPPVTRGQAVVNYVPNNDLDSQKGDHRRIGKIRTKKPIRPLLFDAAIPFLFAWRFDPKTGTSCAPTICELADRLYQLGRTVDIGWAWGEVLPSEELDDHLREYHGRIRRPANKTGDVACPMPGSLKSLRRRYTGASNRFDVSRDNNGQTFRRRSKPKWRTISYDDATHRICLDLRRSESSDFAPWPIDRTTMLVETLRDAAAEKLKKTLTNQIPEIDRALIGRKPDGENDGPTAARVRIIPLPSIGHPQADMQIRRVLVEVPSECAICADDVAWAFSGLRVTNPESADTCDVTPTDDHSMLAHYGVSDHCFHVWRTVTPAAFLDAARRRINPSRKTAEAKTGAERFSEQERAAGAIAQSLRHVGMREGIASVRVQREPFDLRGSRAEEFAAGTRFCKHGLWHVELTFETPVCGPLVIGNGRFLGLGVMRPFVSHAGVYAFAINTQFRNGTDPLVLTKALRRAVMVRVQNIVGPKKYLPTFFSGHNQDGSPAQTETRPHLTFAFDPDAARLIIIAPHVTNRREPSSKEREYLDTLETALQDFRDLRAGAIGCLPIIPFSISLERDRLFAPARIWESLTSYQVTRHAKRRNAAEALSADIQVECHRRGLPRPDVTVLESRGIPKLGLIGQLRLTFGVAVEGPIILGKSRHLGGGLFHTAN